jgi:hypothetical protein
MLAHRSKSEEGGGRPAGFVPAQERLSVGAASRPLLTALSGSPGGFGTNTPARAKAAGSPCTHVAALQNPESGAAVDADALAIGDEAVGAECRRALLLVVRSDSTGVASLRVRARAARVASQECCK